MTGDLVMFKFISKKENDYYFDNEEYNLFYKELKKDPNKSKMLKTTEKERKLTKILKNINNIQKNIKRILFLLKQYKFSDLSSKFDFQKNYSELKIDENGFANYDIENVMKGFNFDLENYVNFSSDYSYIHTLFPVLQSNKNFDLLNILIHLAKLMTYSTFNKDDELTRRLVFFNYVVKNGNDDADNNDDDTISNYEFNLDDLTSFLQTYEEKSNEVYFEDIDDLKYYKYFRNVEKVNSKTLGEILERIKIYNFKEHDHDLTIIKKEFPELMIEEDGQPKFDVYKVLKGFKLNEQDYYDIDIVNNENSSELLMYHSNKEFKLLNILMEISSKANFNEYNNYDISHDQFKIILIKAKFIQNPKDDVYTINTKEYDDFIKDIEKCKIKDGSMVVDFNGEKKEFKKVTLSIGGNYSRYFAKYQYNIKIGKGENLYGRKHLKLRADITDPSLMRTKLISDIHNRLEIPSVSANYITLNINDEYLGLFILTDRYKTSWVEDVFNEKDTKLLYKCEDSTLTKEQSYCINENDEVTDTTEWNELIETLDNAQNVSDIEDIFDVDQFLKEMAIEYLTDGGDHFKSGHNYYMYKPNNGKWKYLAYDYDLDIATEECAFSFEDYFDSTIPLINLLILNDPERFEKILKEVITITFNPNILIPHIDNIKEYVKPFIEKEKIETPEGYYPGRFNDDGYYFYTEEEWEDNTEYGSVDYLPGIKYFISERFQFLSEYYNSTFENETIDDNELNKSGTEKIIIFTVFNIALIIGILLFFL
ncbi:coth-domain-containing protein [Anaeromyces robustus]|uniref:Coth-domain-containing protein n=1 Tax=Anaeromyces robustus TaxID=1754192 RepID=A0A1Y1VSK3_9FUNG|nr:coth-domain-containing protein [Anaeromyces robustus]|eukprot:ORX64270.1 coth-domain-containing protein [Anaeromyces robustus]